MTPEERKALEEVLGYIDAYECGLCGGDTAGQHTAGCPVLVLRAMVQEPSGLYDWSGVPEWVKWIARDKSGKIMGYDNEPSLSTLHLIWVDNDWKDRMQELHLTPNYPVEWQNSLEKRPSNL